MRKITLLIACLLSWTLVAAPLAVAAPQGKAQTSCPVLSGNVDKKIYVDYQGYRIYFCCTGCDAEFKKDPEKYMKKLKDEGVMLEKAPPAGKQ